METQNMTEPKQKMMNRKFIDEVIAEGKFKPEQASLERIQFPQWYKNAKFGIFIHWGIYSVPAFGSEWYPRNMYLQGSEVYEYHRKNYGDQKNFGYKDFIPLFTATNFNPEAWAELIQSSGARFVVPVAEHHDGFAMYQSDLNPWNAAEKGPKRDVMLALKNAVEKRNLKFCASSHRAEHYWFFSYGMQFDSDVKDPANLSLYGMAGEMPKPMEQKDHHFYHRNRPSKAVQEDWLLRTCEMVEKIHPSLIYFDWWVNCFGYHKVWMEFLAYYYNRCAEWNIDGAINFKYQACSPDMAVFDIERGQQNEIYPQFWQADTSIAKTSWGHIANQQYKTTPELLTALIDVVSKNGALLLNIGPRADGTIPEEEQKILRDIGAWLKINGEAIYNTRPYFVFGEGPTEVKNGAFTDVMDCAYTSADIRYTRNENSVYAIGMNTASDFYFKSTALAAGRNSAPYKIKKLQLLGSGELDYEWDDDSLRVKLPETLPLGMPYAIKLEVEF